MYKLFFHLLGLAILEIIFYFYYIGPFENNVFVESFGNSIGGLINRMDSTYEHPELFLNVSKISSDDKLLQELKDESEISDRQRKDYNQKLFNKTLEIWFYCLGITILLIIIYYIIIYFTSNYKRNLSQQIELVELNNEDIELNNNPQENTNKKKYCINILKYILFGGLVLLFEYIFFRFVVLEYHIITDKQIQYLIYKQFNIFITSNYIVIN